MNSPVQPWSILSHEPISVEAICNLHVPPSNFRISPNRYTAGTEFLGSSIAGRIYVLSGRCLRTVGDWRVELTAATFADFPGGAYKFEVLGGHAVKLVYVWDIPERYRAQVAAISDSEPDKR